MDMAGEEATAGEADTLMVGVAWPGRYRGWGYPWYGWGWGFGFGWPYWGWGYPYSYYGYGPSPYSYDCPPGYSCPYNNDDAPPPDSQNPAPGPQSEPPKPWRPTAPGGTAPPNNAPASDTMPESSSPIVSVDRLTNAPNSYQAVGPSSQRVLTAKYQAPKPLRHETQKDVQRAMQALREMPPFAREREIDSGRYSQFSAKDKELLRSVN